MSDERCLLLRVTGWDCWLAENITERHTWTKDEAQFKSHGDYSGQSALKIHSDTNFFNLTLIIIIFKEMLPWSKQTNFVLPLCVCSTIMSSVLSEPTLSAIFVSDGLSSLSRTRPTNSCEPCPLSQLTICRADFLSLTFCFSGGWRWTEGWVHDKLPLSTHSYICPVLVH